MVKSQYTECQITTTTINILLTEKTVLLSDGQWRRLPKLHILMHCTIHTRTGTQKHIHKHRSRKEVNNIFKYCVITMLQLIEPGNLNLSPRFLGRDRRNPPIIARQELVDRETPSVSPHRPVITGCVSLRLSLSPPHASETARCYRSYEYVFFHYLLTMTMIARPGVCR